MSWYDFHGVSLPDVGLAWCRDSLWDSIDAAEEYWQASAIRFPIYPGRVEQFTPPLPVDDNFIGDILVPAIEYAHGKGMRVIIDYHEVDLISKKVQQAEEFWARMAPVVESRDVILELFNEPIEDSWEEYHPNMQRLVSFVRERTDKPLIVGTPKFCQLLHPAIEQPIVGDRIAYAAHIYAHYIPLQFRNEFKLPKDRYHEFDSVERCRQECPVVLTEVGWDREVATNEFTERIESLMSKTSWIAWVVHDGWWPPLVDYCGMMTEFGKDIQRLGLNRH